MINQFAFGDFKSYDDCGLYIEQRPSPTVPQRDITKTHVPGRSGDVIQDNGSFLNFTRTYKVGCSDIDGHIDKIKEMLSQTGYQMLMDTYDQMFYRFAAVVNATSFEEELLNVGHANITFDCEPYKYYAFDIIARSVSTDSSSVTTFSNPYPHDALPRLQIKADAGTSCTIMVNSKSFLFTMPTGNTVAYIDSLSESCYYNTKNLNSGYKSDSWPVLSPGDNTICVIGAKDAKILRRWRTI